ncbi:MAG: hypothetical protein OCC49_10235 [Fibrobacterales bacterium]
MGYYIIVLLYISTIFSSEPAAIDRYLRQLVLPQKKLELIKRDFLLPGVSKDTIATGILIDIILQEQFHEVTTTEHSYPLLNILKYKDVYLSNSEEQIINILGALNKAAIRSNSLPDIVVESDSVKTILQIVDIDYNYIEKSFYGKEFSKITQGDFGVGNFFGCTAIFPDNSIEGDMVLHINEKNIITNVIDQPMLIHMLYNGNSYFRESFEDIIMPNFKKGNVASVEILFESRTIKKCMFLFE